MLWLAVLDLGAWRPHLTVYFPPHCRRTLRTLLCLAKCGTCVAQEGQALRGMRHNGHLFSSLIRVALAGARYAEAGLHLLPEELLQLLYVYTLSWPLPFWWCVDIERAHPPRNVGSNPRQAHSKTPRVSVYSSGEEKGAVSDESEDTSILDAAEEEQRRLFLKGGVNAREFAFVDDLDDAVIWGDMRMCDALLRDATLPGERSKGSHRVAVGIEGMQRIAFLARQLEHPTLAASVNYYRECGRIR